MFSALKESNALLMVDGNSISAKELWHRAARYDATEDSPIVVENSIEDAVRILSHSMRKTGFCGYAPFMKGYLADVINREVGESLRSASGLVSLSSGYSGRPSVRSVLLNVGDDAEAGMIDMIRSKLKTDGTMAVFAPMSNSFSQYTGLLGAGINVATTARGPSGFSDVIGVSNMVATRPSSIESARRRGGYGKRIKAFMTATFPLSDDQLDYLVDSGAESVMDVFATTEVGVLGMRDALASEVFDTVGHVTLEELDGGVYATSPTVDGYFTSGQFVRSQSGVVNLFNTVSLHQGGFLAGTRGKIKVSGFSVSPDIVTAAAIDSGMATWARATATGDSYGSDSITLEFSSRWYNEDEMKNHLSSVLPFYAVPKSVVRVGSVPELSGEQYGNV